MPDLNEELAKNGNDFNFFQTMLLLEEYCRNINIYYYNKIRLSANPDISFPASDISSVVKKNDYFEILLSFMGLIGVCSPLPNYFSEYGAKNSKENCPLIDLLNIFNNRIYYLFFLAWKKCRPVSTEINENFIYQYVHRINCFNVKSEDLMEDEKIIMSYSGMFTGLPRNADGLIEILSDLFEGVSISIEKWNLRWIKLNNLQKIGCDMILGDNSILGERIMDRAGKLLIILKLSKNHSLRLFSMMSDSILRVKKITDIYLPCFMEYDILIQFTTANLVSVVLGNNNTMLGIDTTYGSSGSKKTEYSMKITWDLLNKK